MSISTEFYIVNYGYSLLICSRRSHITVYCLIGISHILNVEKDTTSTFKPIIQNSKWRRDIAYLQIAYPLLYIYINSTGRVCLKCVLFQIRNVYFVKSGYYMTEQWDFDVTKITKVDPFWQKLGEIS